jgi:hypothetical protein
MYKAFPSQMAVVLLNALEEEGKRRTTIRVKTLILV